MINHKIAQPNTMSSELLNDKFIVQFAGENVFKIVNIWRSYKQNG